MNSLPHLYFIVLPSCIVVLTWDSELLGVEQGSRILYARPLLYRAKNNHTNPTICVCRFLNSAKVFLYEGLTTQKKFHFITGLWCVILVQKFVT